MPSTKTPERSARQIGTAAAATAGPLSSAGSVPIRRKAAAKTASPAAPAAKQRSAARKAAPGTLASKAVAVHGAAPKESKPPQAIKLTRPKLVRDGFTMTAADFGLIATLKARAIDAKRPAKKSELLRAGLHALMGMPATHLAAALAALEPIKTGRPKKGS